jgi:5,8-dihydroxy-2-naphthoate synthase
MTQIIRIGHSPDSDDAFMFYALAADKLETTPLRYVHELADIETLNQRALRGELEVSAVSIHAYAHLADRYALLASGSSMGDGYGPRLVSLTPAPADSRIALRGLRVAVPGLRTTAYLALKLYQPDIEPLVVPFDRIAAAVKSGEAEAGLLIHEGQLTFGDEGLQLWRDLGAWWREETGLPLPLGGNVVRKDLGSDLMNRIARDLRASIEYGLAHRQSALAHASKYNRGISAEATDQFVGMYVNQWTVDYGDRGRAAVRLLLERGYQDSIIPHRVKVEFIG